MKASKSESRNKTKKQNLEEWHRGNSLASLIVSFQVVCYLPMQFHFHGKIVEFLSIATGLAVLSHVLH